MILYLSSSNECVIMFIQHNVMSMFACCHNHKHACMWYCCMVSAKSFGAIHIWSPCQCILHMPTCLHGCMQSWICGHKHTMYAIFMSQLQGHMVPKHLLAMYLVPLSCHHIPACTILGLAKSTSMHTHDGHVWQLQRLMKHQEQLAIPKTLCIPPKLLHTGNGSAFHVCPCNAYCVYAHMHNTHISCEHWPCAHCTKTCPWPGIHIATHVLEFDLLPHACFLLFFHCLCPMETCACPSHSSATIASLLNNLA